MAKYCSNCGQEVQENAYVCLKCGAKVGEEPQVSKNPNAKSKLMAGLLGIFLGSLGIHNFYLGYNKKAVIQILLTTVGACLFVGPLISSIWGLVEGIQILTGNINVDANGVPLTD